MFYKTIVAILFLLITSNSFAATESSLKEIYGPRLYGASIDIKYAFKRKVGIEWSQSTYAQRMKFLLKYQSQVEAQQIEQAKIDKITQKEQVEVEKAKLKKEKDEQKAQREAQRQEIKELKEKERYKLKVKKNNKYIEDKLNDLR